MELLEHLDLTRDRPRADQNLLLPFTSISLVIFDSFGHRQGKTADGTMRTQTHIDTVRCALAGLSAGDRDYFFCEFYEIFAVGELAARAGLGSRSFFRID